MMVEMKYCCEGSFVVVLKLLIFGFSKFNRIFIGVFFYFNYFYMLVENE